MTSPGTCFYFSWRFAVSGRREILEWTYFLLNGVNANLIFKYLHWEVQCKAFYSHIIQMNSKCRLLKNVFFFFGWKKNPFLTASPRVSHMALFWGIFSSWTTSFLLLIILILMIRVFFLFYVTQWWCCNSASLTDISIWMKGSILNLISEGQKSKSTL